METEYISDSMDKLAELPAYLRTKLGLQELLISHIESEIEKELKRIMTQGEYLTIPLKAYHQEYEEDTWDMTHSFDEFMSLRISQHMKKRIEWKKKMAIRVSPTVSYPVGYGQTFFNKKLNAMDKNPKGNW